MRQAPLVYLDVSPDQRLHNITKEYACFPQKELVDCVRSIEKHLGNELMTKLIKIIESGDLSTASTILLEYYDKKYSFGITERTPQMMYTVPNNTTTHTTAQALITYVRQCQIIERMD